MREKCLVMGGHVPCNKKESYPAEWVFCQLVAVIADCAISIEKPEFFNGAGQFWIALRNRIHTSELSPQIPFTLDEGIKFLRGELNERHLVTLKCVPECIPYGGGRRVVIQEIEEAKGFLDGVHETLFKTVYTLKRREFMSVHLSPLLGNKLS